MSNKPTPEPESKEADSSALRDAESQLAAAANDVAMAEMQLGAAEQHMQKTRSIFVQAVNQYREAKAKQ